MSARNAAAGGGDRAGDEPAGNRNISEAIHQPECPHCMTQRMCGIEIYQKAVKRTGVILAICHRMAVTLRYSKTRSVDQ